MSRQMSIGVDFNKLHVIFVCKVTCSDTEPGNIYTDTRLSEQKGENHICFYVTLFFCSNFKHFRRIQFRRIKRLLWFPAGHSFWALLLLCVGGRGVGWGDLDTLPHVTLPPAGNSWYCAGGESWERADGGIHSLDSGLTWGAHLDIRLWARLKSECRWGGGK